MEVVGLDSGIRCTRTFVTVVLTVYLDVDVTDFVYSVGFTFVNGYSDVLIDHREGKGTWYVDLYSALDDKLLVLKALRHGSHSLTCKQHHACL